MNNKLGAQTLESMSQAVWYNRWTLEKFTKYLKGDILEVGCGIGNFTDSLTKFGKVWAIDVKKEYISETKQKINGKAQVGIGDIEKGKYFFISRKFDNIICLNVLEHIKDDTKALKNLFSLLKEGGYLILLVPAYHFLFGRIDKSIGHYRRYNKQQLNQTMTGIGFKIINQRTLNMLGAVGWWFFSKLMQNNKIDESEIKLFNLIAPVVLFIENLVEPPFGTSILVIAKKVS